MSSKDVATVSSQDGLGHLSFYEAHQISPVRYRAASVDEHLDRRDALYRSLGLPPVAFKGARVLEVAPGSGQNSLYPASCGPALFELVEPNPTGRKHIEAAYRAFDRSHTVPLIHAKTLQDFEPPSPFDIVICESWLGSLPAEIDLIRKLATFVAPGGVLVITIVPLSGFFPNVMRKLLALRIVQANMSFEEQTRLLVGVFGPHLATMPAMTRSHEDWVHDCMINPAYLNVALPLDTLLGTIGGELEMLATYPRFDTDWRWFKELTGAARGFNSHVLNSYRANIRNFIDHRRIFPPLDPTTVVPLDEAFAALHQTALDYQDKFARGEADRHRVAHALDHLAVELDRLAPEFAGPLDELRAVWSRPNLSPENIRDMTEFGSLFGRETIHVSLTRPRA